MCRLPRPTRTALAWAVATAACLAAALPACAEDDAKTVEQFLARLGLTELQVIHLENILATDLPAAERVEVARRLADLYASLMMNSLEDKARSQMWLGRIQSLVQKVPEADTPSLKVSLLQADYDRAEAKVSRWIADPGDAAARNAAREILARVIPPLKACRAELDHVMEQLIDQIDQASQGDARTTMEKELARLEGVSRRATYFAGWSHYYQGLLGEAPAAAAEDFKTALAAFRGVLGVPSGDEKAEIGPESVDLESIWQTRTLIGLGMAEAAAGNAEASRRSFDLLDNPRVPSQIRDEAGYWRVQGLINAGQLDEAAKIARRQIDAYGGEASPGKVSLCVALVRTAMAKKSAEAAKTMGTLGISGLAKLQQFALLRELAAKYPIDAGSQSGFLLHWLRGQELFATAEKSKRPEDYRAAAEALAAALAARETTTDKISAEQCRYTLAWCQSRLGEHEKAAEAFKQASRALRGSDDATAAGAAWKAVESYRRLAETDSRYVFSAIETLEAIRRDFPDHPNTQKVDYCITQLRRSTMSSKEVLESLQRVAPDNPNYASACYDICGLRYERWTSARGTPGEAAAAAELHRVVATYLAAAAKGQPAPERTLRCLLLSVDVALSSAPAETDRAKDLLAKAAPLAAAMAASSSLAADYHYRSFQLAKGVGDAKGLSEHAAWLARHGEGTSYQLPALVTLARQADEAAASAPPDRRRAAEAEACSIYERLVAILGDSPQTIGSDKNALVANSRLARYLAQLNRHAEAAERLEKILSAYPSDKDYLRRGGLAQYLAGNYDRAIDHWRGLVAGLPKGSEDWYEAKYYQLACLAKIDKPAAREVFAQFVLLYPKLGPPPWQAKFAALRAQIESR